MSDDDPFIDDVVEQIRKAGPLRDPRRPPRGDFDAYLREQVRRSIEMVRLRLDPVRHSPPRLANQVLKDLREAKRIADVSAAEMRVAVKALKRSCTEDHERELLDDLLERYAAACKARWQIPPKHGARHPVKYYATQEALDLFRMFTPEKPPTVYRCQCVAASLVNAVGGNVERDSLRKACTYLRKRGLWPRR